MAKIQTPQPIRGTQDIFGADYDKFEHVVDTFHRIRKLYGFKGVAMPVIEPTNVFARSLGETTDVVSKEMYSFDDRGGDSVTLRPEFTAGLCRAYITNGWQQHAPLKVATHGPLFRYERPQKGRYRQFHQIDAEILGAAEPQADVELLVMADQLLKELGIAEHITLHLNTLGDGPSRDAWRAALVEHFEAHRAELSEDSLERLAKNPLRILDSKDPRDRPIADSAPDIDAYLTDEARAFFDAVTAGLDAAGVAWTRNSRLVRGMDYYRHTAFEFITDQLGAQGTVLGGGRYDGLIGDMGGPETAAVGWAAGVERLAMLVSLKKDWRDFVGLVPDDNEARHFVQTLAASLRRKLGSSSPIGCEVLYSGKSGKVLTKLRSRGITTAIFVKTLNEDATLFGLNFKVFEIRNQHSLHRPLKRIVETFSHGHDFDVFYRGDVSEFDYDLLIQKTVS